MPINGHNSPISINLFNWRFFSCQQFKYLTVTARTEQEARSMLPDSPCLFSARVPAKAVAHV
ncbi:host cell division inhibitor Icd-like protein [Providencia alcalifaciens]